MYQLNVALLVVGGLILVFGLLAGLFKSKTYLPSEPLLAVALGVVIGPAGLGLLDPGSWGDGRLLLQQVAWLTVAISALGIALRLPTGYFPDRARTMLAILGPGMVLMWLASGLLVVWLLDVPFWVAMLIGAVVTPTDPALSGTIVTGGMAERNIPTRVRRFLAAEAGSNDGLAYPLVFLSILMIQRPAGEALVHWITRTILWEVVAAVLLGLLIGYVAGRLQRWALAQEFTETASFVTITVALSFTVLGAIKLLGSDGIAAVFAAGVGFDQAVSQDPEERESTVQEALKHLFTVPIFVLFGMALPWAEWAALGWVGVALAAAILLARRLEMVFLLRRFLRPLKHNADFWFAGWFGPIGVDALYYAALAASLTGQETVWVVASLVVAASVLVHGLTATPLTRLYGRRARGEG